MKLNLIINKKFYSFLIILIFYIIIMFAPRKMFPDNFYGDDYTVHYISTLFLSFCFIKIKINLTINYKIIILFFFVLLKEIFQDLFTSRSFEIDDIVVDNLAIITLFVIYKMLNKISKN